MTPDEYESLVRRLEREAAANPTGYRRKLGALALLGYGYLAVAAVLGVALCALLGWLSASSAAILLVLKKAGLPLAAISLLASRALGLRLPAPQGHRLTRERCPQLFQVIEEVRKGLRAPRAHRVLLTADFNAAIVQHPRLGYLAGSRNYLLLGLPLLQCLSAEELKAVIAHELGHLSGAHGRFGAWIYRVRSSWDRLLSALRNQPQWGAKLFHRCFGWYGPMFKAYSFVQARQQEYEADRMSVEVVGAQPTASALLRVCREREFLGEFWPGVFRRADEEPVPSLSPFTLLGAALKQPSAAPRADWLDRALAQRTSHTDTHPCLADRLQAIGIPAHEPPPVTVSAAEALLGSEAESLRREMDAGWRKRVQGWWVRRYQYAHGSRARLAELECQARLDPLVPEEELWERAWLTEEFSEASLAMRLYEELLGRNAHHVGALWRLGLMRLASDDERGIEQLCAAARLDPALEQPACAAVVSFHRRHGREAEAVEHERRSWQGSSSEQALRERYTVHARDRFLPHALEGSTTAELARRLSSIGGIRKALLVRKPLAHQPERCVPVLAVESTSGWALWRQSAEKALLARISRECRIAPDLLVVSLHITSGLRRTLQRVPGSLIYQA